MLLRCNVADDGETVIPADAMANFAVALYSDIGVHLERFFVAQISAQTAAGTNLYLNLIGRYARIGQRLSVTQ
jgi:hypothetical protein